jgi:hypothetical protein
MPSTRVEWFLRAKRTLRAHPDWSNEQVADYCGIPRAEIDGVVRPARQEVESDGIDPATVHANRMSDG